jgi:hypothetical protein
VKKHARASRSCSAFNATDANHSLCGIIVAYCGVMNTNLRRGHGVIALFLLSCTAGARDPGPGRPGADAGEPAVDAQAVLPGDQIPDARLPPDAAPVPDAAPAIDAAPPDAAAPQAVCGDGRCVTGEASSCCQDCGCPREQVCSVSGRCQSDGLSTLRWEITDDCENGENIRLRFIDQTNNVGWPSLTEVYVQATGATETYSLRCKTGATVCLGAAQPEHDLQWGVGIDSSQHCDTCCAICTTGAAQDQLTCP